MISFLIIFSVIGWSLALYLYFKPNKKLKKRIINKIVRQKATIVDLDDIINLDA